MWPPSAYGNRETVARWIESVLSEPRPTTALWIGCEQIYAGADIIQFYRERSFAPVWVDERGPTALGKDLVETLGTTVLHGLRPEDYHSGCINAAVEDLGATPLTDLPGKIKDLAGLDVIMTDAFTILGDHLMGGKVDPENLFPHWTFEKRVLDVFVVLRRLVEHEDLQKALRELAPPHLDYWRLVENAGRLKAIADAGDWPPVPPGATLRSGDTDPRISPLRTRLAIGGDLMSSAATEENYFGEGLAAAVRRFQSRHGLGVDGVVGARTIEALNVPARERLKQLSVNLERWRWLPHRWGDRYVLVNIAAFSLQAGGRDRAPLEMRVIVGEEFSRTPVFSEEMRYLEINPYWNVPPGIARKELLPRIKKNPAYLEKNRFELLAGWKEDSPVLDPAAIEWSKIFSYNFPGRLRQMPGPGNALGRIKFMFPNRFDVYLHDTSNPELFAKTDRALSHGCIRVERPLELALFVLQDDPAWTPERIRGLIDSGKRHVIHLPQRTKVHILYWTCWVDEQHTFHFRRDIYQRDEPLWDALNRQPGGSGPAPLQLSGQGQK